MGAVTVFVIMAVAWLQKCDNRKDKALYNFAHGKLITTSTAQQWIPCSERLPEEYGEYFVTWMTSLSKRLFVAICEGEVTSEYDHEYNRFKFEWLLDDYIKAYPDVEVIAWMPLPEPYKGGGL